MAKRAGKIKLAEAAFDRAGVRLMNARRGADLARAEEEIAVREYKSARDKVLGTYPWTKK